MACHAAWESERDGGVAAMNAPEGMRTAFVGRGRHLHYARRMYGGEWLTLCRLAVDCLEPLGGTTSHMRGGRMELCGNYARIARAVGKGTA